MEREGNGEGEVIKILRRERGKGRSGDIEGRRERDREVKRKEKR